MKKQEDVVMRAALYPRVSTEEQVMHGFSLDTQEEALNKYAQERGYKVVGIYRDEGFSARKPVMKRKVMQELLEDVKARKIDIILFTKLDRWFRSVGEYHKVQEVLDRYHVTWRAILEDYQTETADGRLKVNIMLSVAENEADRTSERIKFVFRGKIQRGEYCFGGAWVPWGYKVDIIDGVRRLVKDPDMQDAAQAFWDKLQLYQNIRRAGRETNLEYGLHRAHKSWMATVRSEYYSGQFRGVQGFCPSYIERGAWEALQHPELRVKSTQNGRIYLFAGLLRCPECGNTLKSNYKTYPHDRSKEYHMYRCGCHSLGNCPYNHSISEIKLEKYLVDNISDYFDKYATITSEAKAAASATKKKLSDRENELKKLNEQLRRLNNIYMACNISDTEYSAQAQSLRIAIAKLNVENTASANSSSNTIDLNAIRKSLNGDFRSKYYLLSQEERQRFWRSTVAEIHFDGREVSEIIFKV